MKKQYKLLLLFTFYSFLSNALVQEQSLTLHFDSDKHRLTSEHEKLLDNFLCSLELDGDYEFIVKGHTDQDGSFKYNLNLSEKRAESISIYFSSKGTEENQITKIFSGEYELLNPSFSAKAKSENRRVEIIFKSYYFESTEEIMSELQLNDETHVVIDPKEDNVVYGKQGSTFFIEEQSFLSSDGEPYDGKVELVITEALAMADFIEHGLSTEASGELLVSGGMFKLDALDESGNSLTLNPNQEILTGIPSANIEPGMSIFTSSDGSSWDQTAEKPLSRADFPYANRPVQTFRDFKPPISYTMFKENYVKPRKPYTPIPPSYPSAPDTNSYTPGTYPWYDIFSNKKELRKREKHAERTHKTLEKYDENVLKYHRRVELFERQEKMYPEIYAKYQTDSAAYEEDLKLSREKYVTQVYEPSHEKWLEENKEKREALALKLKQWRFDCDSIDQEFAEKIDSLGSPVSMDQSDYFFRQANLGWINIDRFYKDDNGPLREIIVECDPENTEGRMFLHFPEMNSCMSLTQVKGRANRDGIPSREKINLIAYKISDGKVELCKMDISGKTKVTARYQPIKFAEFRKVIQNLT